MRPFGSALVLENRRRLALPRVLEGSAPADVARCLGVHLRTVRHGVADYRRSGDMGLAATAPPGRTPQLSPEQERIVRGGFRMNPTEFGFATELGTAPRAAPLSERTVGVRFHPRSRNEGRTARDITPQKPKQPARAPDQDEIDRGIDEQWPRIQATVRAAEAPAC